MENQWSKKGEFRWVRVRHMHSEGYGPIIIMLKTTKKNEEEIQFQTYACTYHIYTIKGNNNNN